MDTFSNPYGDCRTRVWKPMQIPFLHLPKHVPGAMSSNNPHIKGWFESTPRKVVEAYHYY